MENGKTHWFSDNKANWNNRAALHEASGYGIEELVANPDAVSPELKQDLFRFGNLDGKDVIHLQCHLGTDTVGFVRQGARRVVGVDFSDESLRRASIIAKRCGHSIEFVESNVYDAREAIEGDFDLVYTSLGVLCWLPDVSKWAKVVASFLKRGGSFFIRDDHPMFMTIGDDVSNGLKIEDPYFEQNEPQSWDFDGSYVAADENVPRVTNTVSHQWNHSLGEVISALINAGLCIDKVEETPFSAWCPWPGLMTQTNDGRWRLTDSPERVPMQFVIEAHKP